MKTTLKVIYESIVQAFQQLMGNKLRSFLSLLGITIGIFCIIGVFSSVDSLKFYLKDSMSKLGDDIIYVQKWPFSFGPIKWWEIIKRPEAQHDDYLAIKEKSKTAQLASYHVFIGAKTLKYQSSSVDRTYLIGCSYEIAEMFKMDFYKGRYFSQLEYNSGKPSILIGYDVAEQLFGSIEPIGKKVKLMGRKYEVIGVIEKAGDDPVNPLDWDQCIMVTYNNAKNLANLKVNDRLDHTVSVKAAEYATLTSMKDEVTGIVRSHRKLKPKQKNNFAVNELALVLNALDSFFANVNVLGGVVGILSMLVGGVGVANIMFVSVKERTNIIGVKKALGAKQYMILLEFLIESIVLCVLGGVIGLLLVFGILTAISAAIDFNLFLSAENIVKGLGFSIFVGIISGFIPALQASRLDPVVAMRQ